MQRRKVDNPSEERGERSKDGESSSAKAVGPHSRTSAATRKAGGARRTVGLWFFLLALIMLSVITFMYPSSVQQVEKEVIKDAYKAEHQLEQFLQQQPAGSSAQGPGAGDADPSEAMKAQPSSWVEGEKKLKQKLKVLVERQKKGQDLGVPILTRYLGEDMPAWVGEGVDEKEWKAKRDARYAEMRKEEEAWKEKASKFMEAEQQKRKEQAAKARAKTAAER